MVEGENKIDPEFIKTIGCNKPFIKSKKIITFYTCIT